MLGPVQGPELELCDLQHEERQGLLPDECHVMLADALDDLEQNAEPAQLEGAVEVAHYRKQVELALVRHEAALEQHSGEQIRAEQANLLAPRVVVCFLVLT